MSYLYNCKQYFLLLNLSESVILHNVTISNLYFKYVVNYDIMYYSLERGYIIWQLQITQIPSYVGIV